MVLVEFSMFPTDKGESVSNYVSEIIDLIDKSSISYKLTPMGTIIEGEWDEVMNLITACFRHLEKKSNRIHTSLKVDYRKGTESRLTSKTAKIESLLGREMQK